MYLRMSFTSSAASPPPLTSWLTSAGLNRRRLGSGTCKHMDTTSYVNSTRLMERLNDGGFLPHQLAQAGRKGARAAAQLDVQVPVRQHVAVCRLRGAHIALIGAGERCVGLIWSK